MFKMMSLRTDAGPESLPPFTNGRIDDCLLHVRSRFDVVSADPRHVWASDTRVPEHSPKSYNRPG